MAPSDRPAEAGGCSQDPGAAQAFFMEGRMSFECMGWAVKQKTGNCVNKAVLMNLANKAENDTAVCLNMEIKRISMETDATEKQVEKALVQLQKKQLIEAVPHVCGWRLKRGEG